MVNLKTLISNVQFCFLDVETTGLSPEIDRIYEIALLWECNGEPREVFCYLINPECPIPPRATQIHGITNNMVKHAYSFKDKEITKPVREFLDEMVVVSHNANFDLGFISEEFKRAHRRLPQNVCPIDSLKLAKKQYNFPSNNLQDIARSLELTVETEHKALADVQLLQKVFRHFLKDFQNRGLKRLKQLIELQGGPISFPPS